MFEWGLLFGERKIMGFEVMTSLFKKHTGRLILHIKKNINNEWNEEYEMGTLYIIFRSFKNLIAMKKNVVESTGILKESDSEDLPRYLVSKHIDNGTHSLNE